jgi:hypothetical protein
LRGLLAEFKTLCSGASLVDLAVGIVIGVAFAAVVRALVRDLLSTLIAAIFGNSDFCSRFPPRRRALSATAGAAAPATMTRVGLEDDCDRRRWEAQGRERVRRARARTAACNEEPTMQGQTEQQRLAALEAETAFQRRTLRTIQLVADVAPPEEARVALRAVGALAEEALGEAEPEDHEHPSVR